MSTLKPAIPIKHAVYSLLLPTVDRLWNYIVTNSSMRAMASWEMFYVQVELISNYEYNITFYAANVRLAHYYVPDPKAYSEHFEYLEQNRLAKFTPLYTTALRSFRQVVDPSLVNHVAVIIYPDDLNTSMYDVGWSIQNPLNGERSTAPLVNGSHFQYQHHRQVNKTVSVDVESAIRFAVTLEQVFNNFKEGYPPLPVSMPNVEVESPVEIAESESIVPIDKVTVEPPIIDSSVTTDLHGSKSVICKVIPDASDAAVDSTTHTLIKGDIKHLVISAVHELLTFKSLSDIKSNREGFTRLLGTVELGAVDDYNVFREAEFCFHINKLDDEITVVLDKGGLLLKLDFTGSGSFYREGQCIVEFEQRDDFLFSDEIAARYSAAIETLMRYCTGAVSVVGNFNTLIDAVFVIISDQSKDFSDSHLKHGIAVKRMKSITRYSSAVGTLLELLNGQWTLFVGGIAFCKYGTVTGMRAVPESPLVNYSHLRHILNPSQRVTQMTQNELTAYLESTFATRLQPQFDSFLRLRKAGLTKTVKARETLFLKALSTAIKHYVLYPADLVDQQLVQMFGPATVDPLDSNTLSFSSIHGVLDVLYTTDDVVVKFTGV